MLRFARRLLEYATMSRKPPTEPLIVVLGATGTGKSQLAVDLATRFNGEIINGDAMQMYDGLPIITNKISLEEQQGIPHHLLGFVSPDEESIRVGIFKKKAGRIIQEIRSRGRLPILVGGTHYYTQALLFEDSLIRQKLGGGEDEHTEFPHQQISARFPVLDGPTEIMLERLKEVDPVMFEHWHPNDRRKIRRSLEIFLLTGKKASDIYNEQRENRKEASASVFEDQSAVPLDSTLLFWVHAESGILKERLNSRVDKMLAAGLLDEIKSMDIYLREKLSADIDVDRTRGIWVSIGWKEFEPYLDALASSTASEVSLDSLFNLSVEQTKAATRQYARRQIRWIINKLRTALSTKNALDRFFLLDGTDLTQWTTTVSNQAINITEGFLGGRSLPVPSELSDASKKLLGPEVPHDPSNDVRHECDLCHTITLTEDQWQAHRKSRTHRRLLKKSLQDARKGRSSPPDRVYNPPPPVTPESTAALPKSICATDPAQLFTPR